jgi:hypothetical protein
MPSHDPNNQQNVSQDTKAMPATPDPLDTSQPLPQPTAPQEAVDPNAWQSKQSFYQGPPQDGSGIKLPTVAELTAMAQQERDLPPAPQTPTVATVDVGSFLQAQHEFIKAQTAFLLGELPVGSDLNDSQLRTDLALITTYSHAQGQMISSLNTLIEQAGIVH